MKKKKISAGWVILITSGLVSLIFITVVAINFFSAKKEEYRVVKISEHQGDILLERDDKELDLSKENSFRGMNLKASDYVTTKEEAHMVLLADSDKHIYADENTCFYITATGDEVNGNIKINLEYGAALCEIENKLSPESTFEVETPNATASVRGTTFGVYYDIETNETKVEVFEGAVEIKTQNDTWNVEAGKWAIISGDEGNVTWKNEAEEGVEGEFEEGEFEVAEFEVAEFSNVVSVMENVKLASVPDENSVTGDPILDDSVEREYIVVYSPVAMVLGNGEGFYIFEAGSGASQKDMEIISRELSDQFNAIYGNININGRGVKITYQQIPGFAMDIVKDFCVDTDDYMRDITMDAIGMGGIVDADESADYIDEIMKYVFDFKIVESTPYDFFDGLGLIE